MSLLLFPPFTVVQLRFQEADFTAAEGTDNAVVVTVEKDSPIASPLTFSVAPFTIEEALTAGIISEFEPENPLSPNRASEEILLFHVWQLPQCEGESCRG